MAFDLSSMKLTPKNEESIQDYGKVDFITNKNSRT